MHTYRSNRLESLADTLAHVIGDGLGDVMGREHVVVQSPGMGQWVRMALAERLGVAARLQIRRPRELIEAVYRDVLQDTELRLDSWSRPRLTWALYDMLPSCLEAPAFAPLKRYVEGDTGLRRLQLCRRLAYVFDQYAVYRPDMVLGWEQGQDDGWQAVLWRSLVERFGAAHIAALTSRFEEALARGDGRASLPQRVCVFGITTLPPLFLSVLTRLGETVDVHLFQLAPSREFWGDTRNRNEMLRMTRARDATFDEQFLELVHLDQGNPLLAAYGRVGREFQALLEESGDLIEDDTDRFVDAGDQSLLAMMQQDILTLRDRSQSGEDKGRVARGDRSVQVHGCHGPLREVEVLRDRLLDLLEADPTLEPRDILVMTPDIQLYGPLFEAVFGVDGEASTRLPFTVADRPVVDGNHLTGALLHLLQLAGSRYRQTDVLDLLSFAPVRARHGIAEEELPQVRTLLRDSGARWGLDATHRAEHGQPSYTQNTWQFAEDRLLLGYAMGGDVPFLGRVPMDEVEGGAADLLGRLLSFTRHLFESLARMSAPRTLPDWSELFLGLVDDLIGQDAKLFESSRTIRDTLRALGKDATAAGFTGEVSLESVRSLLVEDLGEERRTGSFLRGGITVCEMLPMRAIPFEVVCLLGMSDGAFPRSDVRVSFDLMAQTVRPGDRSRRFDDRYMCLEAILSARRALILTYIAHSPKDNAELPPSVVLTELLESLDDCYVLDAVDSVGDGADGAANAPPRLSKHVVIHHPLQPFGWAYVDPAQQDRLFTFDKQATDGASKLYGDARQTPPFFTQRLPAADEVHDTLSVADLVRFWDDPIRWFYQRRLGLESVQLEEVGADREPVSVKGLDDWKAKQRLLELRVAGMPMTAALEILRGEGKLPLGNLGKPKLQALQADVGQLIARAAEALEQPARPALGVDLTLDDVRLVGRVGDLRRDTRLVLSVSKAASKGPREQLRLWIHHLVLRAMAGTEVPSKSLLCMGPASDPMTVSLGDRLTAAEARGHLNTLVRWFVVGQREPLRFLPELASSLLKLRGKQDPLVEGAKKYDAWLIKPEREDIYGRLVVDGETMVREDSPFGGEGPGLVSLTHQILAPAHDALGGAA